MQAAKKSAFYGHEAVAGDGADRLRRWLRSRALVQFGVVLSLLWIYGISQGWRGLNGNSQWRWSYHIWFYLPDVYAASVARLLPGLIACGTLLLFLRLLPSPAWRRRLGLVLLLAWGFYYHMASWTTMHMTGPALLGDTMLGDNATGFTGVALDVRRGALPPLSRLLPHYQDYLPEIAMHPKTHPPGDVLLSYAALRIFEKNPSLERAFHSALAAIGTGFGDPYLSRFAPVAQSAGMFLGLLAVIAGLATALPLFALVRRCGGDEPTAWIAAALWIHYPAFLCMTPSYDQIYAFLAISSLWAFRKGFDRMPLLWGAVAGLIGAASILLTFKMLLWLPLFLPLLAMDLARQGGSLRPAAIRRALEEGEYVRRRCALALAFFIALAGSLLALKPLTGIDMIRIFAKAQEMQAELTAALKRTYWIWTVYGPYDVLMLGGPVLSLIACGAWVLSCRRGPVAPQLRDPAFLFFPVGLALTALSGAVLGENARQLLMFGPGLAWAAAAWLCRPGVPGKEGSLTLVLAAQHFFTVTCIASMFFIGRN